MLKTRCLKIMLLSLLACVGYALNAQQEDADMKAKGFSLISQSGKFFSITLEPAGKNIKLTIAGKKIADIDLAKAEIAVEAGMNPSQSITAERQLDPQSSTPYYILQPKSSSVEHLKINVRSGKYKDVFEIPHLN